MSKLFLVSASALVLVGSSVLVSDQPARRAGQVQLSASANSASSDHAISAQGRIEGASEEVELRPQMVGRVVEVLVQAGDEVLENQPLLRLDSEEYQAEVSLAAASLAEAEAQLARLLNGAHEQERRQAESDYRAKLAEFEHVRLTWERSEGLHASGAIPTQEYDEKRSAVATWSALVDSAQARVKLVSSPAREDEVRTAHARIAAAKARLQIAEVLARRTEMRAPRAGRVLAVDVHAGEIAGPESPEPLITLADTSHFRVRCFVEEMDATRVSLGMGAVIRVDGILDQTFSGRVTQLSPRMSRKRIYSDAPDERIDTKTREVWIELDGRDDWIIGLRVEVSISSDTVSATAGR